MKNIIVTLALLAMTMLSFGQHKLYKGRVYDGITFQPITGASVYNMNTNQFAFTNKEGNFSIQISLNDTIVVSKSVYRQLVVVINKNIFYGMEDFFLYYKATMLPEVRIIAINPSYEGFKKDIVTLELPEYYKRAEDIKLSEFEKANATYKPNGNLLSLGGTITTSPISYLYDTYSRKSKMNRLYNEMVSYEDEVARIQEKFNRDIVSEITGLKDDALLDFMIFCRFSYYDLVRMKDEEINSKIKAKFFEYQYNKMMDGEKKR